MSLCERRYSVSFYDEAYAVQGAGGFLIPSKVQPKEHSMGSGPDGTLHKRAQPRQPAQCPVLQPERQQVEPELEQPRQPVERQQSRGASLSVISSKPRPLLLRRGLCLRKDIFLPATEHFADIV